MAPKTPLDAAIAAGREFKALLEMQPAGTLFWPRRLGGDLLSSHTYQNAVKLLDQAVAQNTQGAEGSGFMRCHVQPVVDIVANDGANVPANQLKLFADITVGIAQVVIQILEERHGRGVHGGFLEIGVRVSGEGNVLLEQVEGERDAVHKSSLEEIIGTTLCHGASAASTNAGGV